MTASFFDTNVLVYLAYDDTTKADRAEELVAAGGAISVQVLNELANVARRKMRMTWAETRDFLATVRELLTVHPLTAACHESGLRLAQRYRLSIYDAMIAASALDGGCDILWSEDMQHGLVMENKLQVCDPFR